MSIPLTLLPVSHPLHQPLLLGNSHIQVQPRASDLSDAFANFTTCGTGTNICGTGTLWHRGSLTCTLEEDYEIEKSYAKFGVRLYNYDPSGSSYRFHQDREWNNCPAAVKSSTEVDNEQCHHEEFTLPEGEKLRLRLKTGEWSGEIGIVLELPNGTNVHWEDDTDSSYTGSFQEQGNTYNKVFELYPDGSVKSAVPGNPAASNPDSGDPYWEAAGVYKLTMYDTWGDGSNTAPSDVYGECRPPADPSVTDEEYALLVEGCAAYYVEPYCYTWLGTETCRGDYWVKSMYQSQCDAKQDCVFTGADYYVPSYTQAYMLAADRAADPATDEIFQDLKSIWVDKKYCDSPDAVVELCGDDQIWSTSLKRCLRNGVST